MEHISPALIRSFQKKVYDYCRINGRDLPWRKTIDPYHIVVSEIMLQQTQVDRVSRKYPQFINAFPDFASLDRAPLQKILTVWHGMGYNRRALFLKKTAHTVIKDYNGRFPEELSAIERLPGIGKHTAASICAFAFNKPVIFIETNIRTVFIHEFFKDKKKVDDAQLYTIVEQALDRTNPCRWYNALMDYGVMLKKQYNNPGRRSAHYYKQSPFEGSNRQVRGAIIGLLTRQPLTRAEIRRKIDTDDQIVAKNLTRLTQEGFIKEKKEQFSIA